MPEHPHLPGRLAAARNPTRSPRFAAWMAPLAGLCLAVTGCPPAHSEPDTPAPTPAPTTPLAAVTPAYRYPEQTPVADSLAVKELVDRARGSVVVLYFWTRFSDECRAELPRVVRLQAQYRDAGLRVIACNVDDVRDWDGQTRPLLMSVRGNFPCVVVPEASREPLRTWLGSDWKYEWPARFLFNREGVRTAMILAQSPTPFADMELALRDLLGAGAADAASEPVGDAPRVEVKLLDLHNAKAARSFPPLTCTNPEAIDDVADQIARLITRPSARVAVLPFVQRGNPTAPHRDGTAAADRLARDLHLAGIGSVVDPAASQVKLQQIKLNAVDIDLDPAALTGKWNVDYVVLGWWIPPKATTGAVAGPAPRE